MREKKLFGFDSLEDSTMWNSNWELLKQKIAELGMKMTDKTLNHDDWIFAVYTDTSDYKIIWQEAEKMRLRPKITGYKMEYIKKDLENAQYYLLSIGIFGHEDYTESYSTQYEEVDVCNKCGRSIRQQISELYIDKTQFKGKDISMTTNHEIVISEKLYNIFLDNNLTGAIYKPVKHKNNKMKSEPIVYQLITKNVLPKMHESTTFHFDEMAHCEECKAYGTLLTSIPKYSNENMNLAKDINSTFEYIGGGYSGYRNCIISKKLYNVLKYAKIKGVKYDIVELL